MKAIDFEELAKDPKNKEELMKIPLRQLKYDPDYSFLKNKVIKDIGFIDFEHLEGGLQLII